MFVRWNAELGVVHHARSWLCECKIPVERFKRSELLYTVLVSHVRVYYVLNLLTIPFAGQRPHFHQDLSVNPRIIEVKV